MGIKSDTNPQGCDLKAACAELSAAAAARFASPLTFRRSAPSPNIPNWVMFNVWYEHADEAAVRMAGIDYRLHV